MLQSIPESRYPFVDFAKLCLLILSAPPSSCGGNNGGERVHASDREYSWRIAGFTITLRRVQPFLWKTHCRTSGSSTAQG